MVTLLINPGSFRKKVYQDLSKDFSAIETPFWLALTAGFLRKNNQEVKVLDANAENLDIQETAEKAIIENPKLINIVVYGQHPSASTQLMDSVIELCKTIKRINIYKKIILTGIHPSALPERTLEETNADYVCEGEGFYTILGLLQDKPLSEIPGLWYKEDSQIKNNSPAPLIQDLDNELSDIAWDLLPMDKYKAHNWHCFDDLQSRKSYASISTSLGCPFNCSFCCINAPFGKPSYRTWTPEWVIKQLEILSKDYKIKNIKFIDELFILKPEHFLKIAEKITEKNLKFNIWVYARVDTVKEEHLPILKKAGFNWFCFGFESGNKKVRLDVSKGNFNKKDMIDISRMVRSNGINIISNFMFGLPEDNLDTMKETLKLAQELNCEFTNFYCVTAYPGSKLYSDSIKNNMFLPKKWSDYAQHSYNFLPLPTKHLTPKQVLRFRDNAFDIYFKNKEYLDMIKNKFGSRIVRHIKEMTKLKLKRKWLN